MLILPKGGEDEEDHWYRKHREALGVHRGG